MKRNQMMEKGERSVLKRQMVRLVMILSFIMLSALMTVPAEAAGRYYCSRNVLYSPTGKKLKTLPVRGDEIYSVSTGYNGRVYLSKSSLSRWQQWTYMYDLKTKKLTLAKTGVKIIKRSGKYVTTQDEYVSDVSPFSVSLYRITATGKLQKIKTLTKAGKEPVFSGGKLYYTIYPGVNSLHRAALYRCNMDGSGKKWIHTFKSPSSDFGNVFVSDMTSKNCRVYIDGKRYVYTYATKKMRRI